LRCLIQRTSVIYDKWHPVRHIISGINFATSYSLASLAAHCISRSSLRKMQPTSRQRADDRIIMPRRLEDGRITDPPPPFIPLSSLFPPLETRARLLTLFTNSLFIDYRKTPRLWIPLTRPYSLLKAISVRAALASPPALGRRLVAPSLLHRGLDTLIFISQGRDLEREVAKIKGSSAARAYGTKGKERKVRNER
jgi:hypothetical protein